MRKRKVRKGRVFLAFLLLIIISGIGALFVIKPDLFGIKKNDKKSNQISNKVEEKKSEPEPTPEPKEPEEKRMSIVMVGDALIHGAIYMDASVNKTYTAKDTYKFGKMFKYIKPMIAKYDLRYYNQESIIGGGTPQHYPRLNSPDAIGLDLLDVGFNLVSLANNHSFDQGESGLKHSLKFWKKQANRAHTAGSYASAKERDTIPVYEQNGIKYAFLSYTIPTNGLSAPAGKEYYVNVYDRKTVKQDVINARKNGAEVVMVAMHWGVEYTHVPNQEQKTEAKYLSKLGVNLVIGAHPHVIQPIEYVGNTLVIYSLGNFIAAQKVLGEEKQVGLMVGTNIVVKDGKVSFEKTGFQLTYTYSVSDLSGYQVIPFNKLSDKYLSNYKSKNKKYRNIVDPKGVFNGN